MTQCIRCDTASPPLISTQLFYSISSAMESWCTSLPDTISGCVSSLWPDDKLDAFILSPFSLSLPSSEPRLVLFLLSISIVSSDVPVLDFVDGFRRVKRVTAVWAGLMLSIWLLVLASDCSVDVTRAKTGSPFWLVWDLVWGLDLILLPPGVLMRDASAVGKERWLDFLLFMPLCRILKTTKNVELYQSKQT